MFIPHIVYTVYRYYYRSTRTSLAAPLTPPFVFDQINKIMNIARNTEYQDIKNFSLKFLNNELELNTFVKWVA